LLLLFTYLNFELLPLPFIFFGDYGAPVFIFDGLIGSSALVFAVVLPLPDLSTVGLI